MNDLIGWGKAEVIEAAAAETAVAVSAAAPSAAVAESKEPVTK
jgi:hypothetical protein